MHPEVYNPCDDGFAAKVWECLRRNPEYQSVVKRLLAAKTDWEFQQAWPHHFLEELGRRHGFAYDALPRLSEPDSGVKLEYCWCELPAEFRKSQESIFAVSDPMKLKLPDFHTLDPYFDVGNEENARKFLSDLGSTCQAYDLIAVPKFVWDNAHRIKILEAIDELVGKPITKTVYLRPGGQTLGTKAQWDAFLLTEWWRNQGCSAIRARALAAWRMFDAESYCQRSHEYLLSDKGHNEVKAIDQQRGSTVTNLATVIGEHISNVYPEFRFD